jgi:hypothetical protein
MTNEEIGDRLAIGELAENWALLRDARRWNRFRELWHEDGRMITSWVQGTVEDFIKASQAGYDKGVRFLIFLVGQQSTLTGRELSLKRR